jgi:hypothetical protein
VGDDPTHPRTGMATYLREEVFTDFYVAVDIAQWPGTDLDQAIAVVGRASLLNPNDPLKNMGVVANYDASQNGQTATSRRGGQFQINFLLPAPAEALTVKTVAAAEITFAQDHPQRLILKGVGSHYTAMVYDYEDFTRPVVTIEADDVIQGPPQVEPFTSGRTGLTILNRRGTVTDATFDNFYSSATDPNAGRGTAIAHPITGTPVVDTRVPAQRFKNFHDPAEGISFTAKTFSADSINVAATKMWLNGVDVSSKLALSGAGPSITGSLPGSALKANAVYTAKIVVEDSSGQKRSTNSFWFDTFSDTYLASSAVKVIEAEDYNFSAGQFIAGAIPVSGTDTNGAPVVGDGYAGQAGISSSVETEAVDFFDRDTAQPNEYRTDTVDISAGTSPELTDLNHAVADGTVDRYTDNVRSKFASKQLIEYVVQRTQPGEWMNYTRTFVPGSYRAYLRVGAFGASAVELRKVTSTITTGNQTTSKLGTFNIPNQIARYNYNYIPLTDDGGNPVSVSLSGLETLRLQMAGTTGQDDRKLTLNYILLVPTLNVSGPTVADTFTDGNDSANPIWQRIDPLSGLGLPAAQYTFPNGAYQIVAPTPPILDAGTARAFTLLKDVIVSDFYMSVDIVDFDDTVRQILGLAARITEPGLGATDGYLFSWEPGSGTLPTATGGDLDMLRIQDEVPTGQIETESSSFHLERGKSYRMVLIGTGFEFEGRIYELPDTSNPVKVLHGRDTQEAFASGGVGLVVADQTSGEPNKGDATFDNFLVTTAEPRISVAQAGAGATLSWPRIPFRLQSTPTVGPAVWTDVTAGITQDSETNMYTAPGTTAFYRLVYP